MSGRAGGGGGGGGRGRGPGRPRGGTPRAAPTPAAEGEPIRLQVYLARAGVASRRASEELILSGRVAVNGRTVTELGSKVDPGTDRVAVDGRAVVLKKPVWIALHKPRGYVTTRDDPEGRRTVYDLLPPELHHLFHVGRLDRQSEGLLLLTNEGEGANRLMHPRYGVDKEYVVTIEGAPTHDDLDRLVDGIEADGETFRAEAVEVLPATAADTTRIKLILREGRNREVRRMFEALGHGVAKLTRRRFGPIRLGKLRRGDWRELTADELRALNPAPRSRSRPS
jgi:23S rRNA pseudouridine2605 synthase